MCVNQGPAGWGAREAAGKTTSGTMVYFAPTMYLAVGQMFGKVVKLVIASHLCLLPQSSVTAVTSQDPLHKSTSNTRGRFKVTKHARD